jgi:hypothetical protein
MKNKCLPLRQMIKGSFIRREQCTRRPMARWWPQSAPAMRSRKAATLGLVPKQISIGDRTILGKISKRGNRYVRVLFVQAAWVVLIKPRSWQRHGLKPWLEAANRIRERAYEICNANGFCKWLRARPSRSALACGRAGNLGGINGRGRRQTGPEKEATVAYTLEDREDPRDGRLTPHSTARA